MREGDCNSDGLRKNLAIFGVKTPNNGSVPESHISNSKGYLENFGGPGLNWNDL